MKIVCLGDSITYGYGVPRSKCWVSLVKKESGCTVVNAGINGDTTAGMLARVLPDAFAENPDVLMLFGGTNDLTNGCPAGVIQSNAAAIIQQARQHNIRTMLGTPLPVYPDRFPQIWRELTAFRAPQSEFSAYSRWTRVFAPSTKSVLVDFYSAIAPLSDADPASIFQDGLHPNTRGHRIMADVFLEALKELQP